jgi:hypothetical protein
MARIDAPRLDELDITIFDTPQLFQFISRRPTLRAPEKGHIAFHSKAITVEFPSQISDYAVLSMEIRCTVSEWQLLSLGQVCTSSLPPLSTLECLYIFEDRGHPPRCRKYAISGTFTSVRCCEESLPMRENLYHVLRTPCKNLSEPGRQKCCQR